MALANLSYVPGAFIQIATPGQTWSYLRKNLLQISQGNFYNL